MSIGSKKLNIWEIRNPFYFSLIAVVLTGVFFLLFLSDFRFYRSEISIILIPKTERTSLQSDAIMENLVTLPKNLSFYEKILHDNPQLNDSLAAYSQDEKKIRWNEMIKIERVDGSSIIKLSVISRIKENSAVLAKYSTYTLFDTVAYYYNVNSDINLSIVEGPITNPFVKNWIRYIFLSLLMGLIVSLPVYWIFYLLFDYLENRKQIFHFPKFNFGNWQRLSADVPAKKYGFPNFSKKPELPPHEGIVKKSPVPGNLPIALPNLPTMPIQEEIIPQIFSEKSETEEIIEAKEPTEEEYKKRLNQLLKGDL
jgi:capsular polysaccharide biosynthesis protein